MKTKYKNLHLRIPLLALIIIPILYFMDFYQHFYVYLTGNIITDIILNQWHIVVFFILVFIALLIPLSFRRKANWVEYGLVSAFFISLFIEMYGIPLTIILASNYFFTATTSLPNTILVINFLGVNLAFDWAMLYGSILMIIGAVFILTGWITLYRNIKNKKFVTSGIYSYSRHPQYLGFILIILGWFIGWPTILTVIFAPILIYKYIRLCKTEEKEIASKVPSYKQYRKNVPFFI